MRTWTGWARSVHIYELGPLKEIALENWKGEKKGTGGGEMGGPRSNAVSDRNCIEFGFGS